LTWFTFIVILIVSIGVFVYFFIKSQTCSSYISVVLLDFVILVLQVFIKFRYRISFSCGLSCCPNRLKDRKM